MFRPQVALLLGVLLLALGFAVGVEPVSTSVSGKSYECGSVIQPGWLESGTPRGVVEVSEAPEGQRAWVESQCRSRMARAEWLTWGTLVLGGLAALLGWTVLRERAAPPTARPMSQARR